MQMLTFSQSINNNIMTAPRKKKKFTCFRNKDQIVVNVKNIHSEIDRKEAGRFGVWKCF